MNNNILKTHFSIAVSGLGNNNFCRIESGEETEFLSWYKIRRFGKLKAAIKYFNVIYSTGNGVREQPGDEFLLKAAFIGWGKAPGKTPEVEVRLTFGGRESVKVIDGYESDDADIDVPEGSWLSVRLIVCSENGATLLTTEESASRGYRNGLRTLNVLRPNFIGCRAESFKTAVFFGDSITQGTRTATDGYEAWSHRTGLAMEPEVSVINNGVGWARAYDAEADGVFLSMAKTADLLTLCFGVNDINSGGRTGPQLIESLGRTIALLKEEKPDMDIVLFTVPPFNMEPWGEEQRQYANRVILSGCLGVRVFDFASVLEAEPGRVRPEFMADSDDAHPNGKAGEAAAAALMKYLGMSIKSEE